MNVHTIDYLFSVVFRCLHSKQFHIVYILSRFLLLLQPLSAFHDSTENYIGLHAYITDSMILDHVLHMVLVIVVVSS